MPSQAVAINSASDPKAALLTANRALFTVDATPPDARAGKALRMMRSFERHYQAIAKPFQWQLTRDAL